jgi:soluble lytic murein transglycosylase-like protein
MIRASLAISCALVGGLAPAAAAGADLAETLRLRRADYRDLIAQEAERSGVRAALLHAVIEVESAYRPNAISRAGAVGLMQLMPETAKRYGVEDSRDPRQNVAGGAAYLADLHERFDGDLHLVLAAYNAGEDAVERFGGRVPPYAETRDYVRRVVNLLRHQSAMLVVDPPVEEAGPRHESASLLVDFR